MLTGAVQLPPRDYGDPQFAALVFDNISRSDCGRCQVSIGFDRDVGANRQYDNGWA